MTTPFLSESQRYENLPLGPSGLVIDAGAYMGDAVHEFVTRYDCCVIALEPVPEFFEHTKKRFAGNPKVTVLNQALAAFDGHIDIGLSNNSSGLYSPGEKRIRADAVTLESLLKAEKVKGRFTLKMNIEGAEFGVLENILKAGLMPRIDNLCVQFHWNAPRAQDRYEAIRQWMLETHDHTWGEDPTLWQSYTLKA